MKKTKVHENAENVQMIRLFTIIKTKSIAPCNAITGYVYCRTAVAKSQLLKKVSPLDN